MVHFIGKSGTGAGGGGGGGGGGGSIVGFSPGGGAYSGTSKNVTITVTNATKLRWKINAGAYTTVNATSTVVAVALVSVGKTLYADALDASGNVLASAFALYQSMGGGS